MAHVNKIRQKAPIKTVPRCFNIDYVKMIDALDEPAFRFYVEQVYPIYNYRIISITDIRPIDMKENLLRMAIPGSDKDKQKGTAGYFGSLLRGWFKALNCEKGSRADLYRDRAMKVLEGPSLSYADLEDAVIVFTALFREEVKLMHSKQKVANIDLDLDCHDAKLLAFMLAKDNRNHFKQIWNILSTAELNQTVDFIYINCLLVLCKVLKDRGEFLTGDNQ